MTIQINEKLLELVNEIFYNNEGEEQLLKSLKGAIKRLEAVEASGAWEREARKVLPDFEEATSHCRTPYQWRHLVIEKFARNMSEGMFASGFVMESDKKYMAVEIENVLFDYFKE